MNSEIPQVPESEPNRDRDYLESLDNVDDDFTDIEAELIAEVSDSDNQDFFNDMWDDENITDSSSATRETPVESVVNESLPQDASGVEEKIQETVTEDKTELFTDTWLEESTDLVSDKDTNNSGEKLTSQITALEAQKAQLIEEIRVLEARKEQAISQQVRDMQETLGKMIEEGMGELKERKNSLIIDIDKLERRRERIQQEMRSNFAGVSQDLAVRIQGFKEYLVGSLQDLASAAEQLELPQKEIRVPSRETGEPQRESRSSSRGDRSPQPQFTDQAFADQNRRIRQILDQYRTNPDYYGPPWQLRRTFEPIHAERVQDWFFTKGGRGAIKGMGSRLQNILVTSAIVSVLYRLHRDRFRVLVLVDTPEKLGEWRRGLQDCLGISRSDFGSSRGVVLFESAEVLVQRADRLLQDKLLPLVVIDETEELINLSLLKFPLWLAFTVESQAKTSGYPY